jgi:penicillin amidase
MQNVVHAGRDGDIGLYLPGKVPLRSADNDSLGLVPAKGWEARYDWTGYIPDNALPRIDNPKSGQIATANNKTVPPGYAYTLTREWDVDYRFKRADQMLRETKLHSIESFKTIQLDTYDGYAAVLTPLLLKAKKWSGEEAAIAERLREWNFHMDADRSEPLIFAAWDRALVKRVLSDELGKDFKNFWTQNPTLVLNILRDQNGEARWCDDVTTKAKETCAQEIAIAFDDAVKELKGKYGSDWKAWRWGDAHHAIMAHLPFENVPFLRSIFSRDIEASGGAFTLRRGDYKMNSARPYAASHASGFRALMDLKNPDDSLYVIATGESGNIFSDHYDDLMPLWAKGEYVRIPQTQEEVERISEHRLTLQRAE